MASLIVIILFVLSFGATIGSGLLMSGSIPDKCTEESCKSKAKIVFYISLVLTILMVLYLGYSLTMSPAYQFDSVRGYGRQGQVPRRPFGSGPIY